MCLPVTPPNLTPRVAALADALRGGFRGERHRVSLWLAGAMLARGVDPAAVPAACHDVAADAGWDASAARKNAEDTVARRASGLPVRSDLPPSIVPALDAFCSWVSGPTPSLRDQQHRLRRAIAEVPRGRVRLVRAPCGIGKTHTTIQVSLTQPVVVSTPTNELAKQVTADIRAAGATARRLYGPASHPDCRFGPQAAQLARGRLSVRWEMCEGRGVAKCPHYDACDARRGREGDGSSLVGNHGLLGALAAVAGTKRTLVIDEPPATVTDVVLTRVQLQQAHVGLQLFEPATVDAMLPAVERLLRHMATAEPDVSTQLHEPVQLQRISPIREHAVQARQHLPTARQIADTAAVLQVVRQALTQRDAEVTVIRHHATGERQLSVTAIHPQLAWAIRREGRTVVMAADVELYAHHYERLLGYRPELIQLQAPDGCPVRRVLVQVRAATRSNWIAQGNFPGKALEYALGLARETGPRVGVVTFYGLASRVRERLPDVPVRHFGALRGLNNWRDFDAVVTLGDPRIPLDAAGRVGVDADQHARAELEQAHGRLRVVHRQRPAAMVHVGSLVPMGWREPVEVLTPPAGRPRAAAASTVELAMLVAAIGKRAAGRMCGVTHTTVGRWMEMGAMPAGKVAVVSGAVAKMSTAKGSDLSGTQTPI